MGRITEVDEDFGAVIVEELDVQEDELKEKETVEMDFGDEDFTDKEEMLQEPDSNKTEVDTSFEDMGNDGIFDKPKELPKPVEENTEVAKFEYTESEMDYEQAEFNKKAAPILQKAMKVQKEEFHEVVLAEVDTRVDAVSEHLKKHKKKRIIKKIVKWLFILGVVVFLWCNDYVHHRAVIIFNDTKELVIGLKNGEDVSSNKLAEDILKSFGWKGAEK